MKVVFDTPFCPSNKSNNLPYLRHRDYIIIKQICKTQRSIKKRLEMLKYRGYDIHRVYVPNYNGIANYSYMKRLNELRIIVGRPTNHFVREVYAIIIKP